MDVHMAGIVINALTSLLLITGIGVIATKRMVTALRIIIIQALILSVITIQVGFNTGERELYLVAAITLLVKGIIIPAILGYVIKKVGVHHQVEPYINIPTSLLAAGGLTVLAYGATSTLLLSQTLTRHILPVSIALILMGLLVMVTRKKAVTQIIGLIMMENGLYLAAVAMTQGMPLVVELGIFFDLLIGILIMGILIFRINETFESIDTAKLKSLKG